jgi:hypothetical protein
MRVIPQTTIAISEIMPATGPLREVAIVFSGLSHGMAVPDEVEANARAGSSVRANAKSVSNADVLRRFLMAYFGLFFRARVSVAVRRSDERSGCAE